VKKRLLHVTLWLDYGGLEKIVYDFSREFNQEEYEIYVVALERAGAIFEQLRQAGIFVSVLSRRPGKIDLVLLKRLVKLIRHLHIDIIHSHSGCIMYAALCGRIAGVNKIIHTEHGRYLPDSIGRIWEDRLFSRLISKYVCVSKDLEKYVLSRIKVPREKVVMIINGIDTSRYYRYGKADILKLRQRHNIRSREVVLGTVCRLIPEKNIGFLIDWMKMNSHSHENLRVMIVGDGPQYAELVRIAQDLPESKVQFLGARADISDLLNIFDIFVLPSTTEGTSLTILEAMSTKLPVIASDVGGNKYIINHGETGFLFEVNNMDSFTKCLNKILSDPVFRDKMGLRARALVEKKYSFERMLRSYRTLYM
jgi:sugar transferase (PEP-CTERM/EpsH1 system associated)